MEDPQFFFFFQAEDGIRDYKVTGVQTCALPISMPRKEKGCGPRRVIAAKAPSMRPVASVWSKPGRWIRYTRRYSRLGVTRGCCLGGGSGRAPAPIAVGGHRGGGASRALASVASWNSSVAVIAPSGSTAPDQPPQTPPRGERRR